MLALSRHVDERVLITNKATGQQLWVMVSEIRAGRVVLVFEDDAKNFLIKREEILDKEPAP